MHHRLATTRPRHAPVYFHHLSVRLCLSFSNILTIMDWYRTCVYCAPPQFFVSYLRHPVGARSAYALCSWFESREHHRSHRLCQTIAKKKTCFYRRQEILFPCPGQSCKVTMLDGDRYYGKFDRQPTLLEPSGGSGGRCSIFSAHFSGIPGGIPDRYFRRPSRINSFSFFHFFFSSLFSLIFQLI